MIDAIGQYDVSIKGQNFYEVRVTNLKKELTLTKDLMKHHMVEWQKKKKNRMFNHIRWMERQERDKMFELLDKWVEQVGE